MTLTRPGKMATALLHAGTVAEPSRSIKIEANSEFHSETLWPGFLPIIFDPFGCIWRFLAASYIGLLVYRGFTHPVASVWNDSGRQRTELYGQIGVQQMQQYENARISLFT